VPSDVSIPQSVHGNGICQISSAGMFSRSAFLLHYPESSTGMFFLVQLFSGVPASCRSTIKKREI
jgi:hypothetical protein